MTGSFGHSNKRHAWVLWWVLVLVLLFTIDHMLLPTTEGFTVLAPFGRLVSTTTTTTTTTKITIEQRRKNLPLCLKKDDDDDDDDDDDIDIDLSNQDWRAFRAKLVMGGGGAPESESESETDSNQDNTNKTESSSTSTTILENSDDEDLDGIGAIFTSIEKQMKQFTPLDPSQWAYDSGKVIEQGAIILGGVEQNYGFGLRQQYFHKAAILVLDHDEKTFTKGIILNRPTDLTLQDDINQGIKWRVWFGGDVQGLNTRDPDIVCLHSLKNEQVLKASIPVMNDIHWTSFDNAKRLVKIGAASPKDFWVFCGYAGWGPRQLMGELDRKSWYMVATDSNTLLKELSRLTAGSDPRDAGLDTWNLLMNMIGRSQTAKHFTDYFDDLMLKEWALKNLLSKEAGGGGGMVSQDTTSPGLPTFQDLQQQLKPQKQKQQVGSIDDFLSEKLSSDLKVGAGSLLRASAETRSPFLLHDQELHKSVVLVLIDDDMISVGVILNRPSSKGAHFKIKDSKTGAEKTISIPMRYGGQYALRGTEPLMWIHCNPTLRQANVGSPIGPHNHKIYKCTERDVKLCIADNLATPEDFMVVNGVTIWTKAQSGGLARGIEGEVVNGNFEVVPQDRVADVFSTLVQQKDVLSKLNLAESLKIANLGWAQGQGKNGDDGSDDLKTKEEEEDEPRMAIMSGLGENFDEEDDTVVFKSDTKISDLSDTALRAWVATFLLGLPELGTAS